MKSQCQRVINYLKINPAITSADAWRELGIMRLASRIHDLTNDGYKFKKTRKRVYNKWNEKCSVMEYCLESDNGQI